jgi:hypothetical protein
MSGSPKWPLSLRLPHQSPVHASSLPHTCYMPHPSHSSRFIVRTILDEEYRSLRSSSCNCIHYLVTSSLLHPNIFLYALFSNSLHSSLNVSDQAAHPYKTTGKIIVLHRNPQWWSPIISPAYGVNLDRRMLDKMLYVVHKSDMLL